MPLCINLGIVAHVDAGKTTLTEQILWRLGAIRSPGRVDSGTTQTDYMDIEKQRGISVQATAVSLPWRDVKLNLIDTPGHVDFASEVERALRILDVAILVVSAAEGVQSHTKVLWDALKGLGIPTLFFLNKMDRIGADAAGALREIRSQLGANAFFLKIRSQNENPPALEDREPLLDALCGLDDALLERYLENGFADMSDGELLAMLTEKTRDCQLSPALCGAALSGEGVAELLDALYALAPRAGGNAKGDLAGWVYRVVKDEAHGRVAHVKLYSGTLGIRDTVHNHTQDTQEKVFQIREIHGRKSADSGVLTAGDIGAIYGLGAVRVGDILGNPSLVPGGCSIAVPLLRVRVFPEDEAQLSALVAALDELSAEDPLLESAWGQGEAQVRITGTIQLEVLAFQLKSRFGLAVTFAPPSVIYKETPSTIAEGFEAYTMPKPCWAVLRFLIEPMPRGSGVEYQCAISNEKIHYRYQGQIRQTLPTALEQGPMGWEVVDLRVTLIDGGDHPIHTHPLDFALATPLAMMDGLVRAGTTLLEPMLRVNIAAPEAYASRIVGDFLAMRGQFNAPVIRDGQFLLEGRLPVATSLDYPVRLASLSGGQATYLSRFDGYDPCPTELGATAPNRGVDPRERAKYILWKRSALEA